MCDPRRYGTVLEGPSGEMFAVIDDMKRCSVWFTMYGHDPLCRSARIETYECTRFGHESTNMRFAERFNHVFRVRQ